MTPQKMIKQRQTGRGSGRDEKGGLFFITDEFSLTPIMIAASGDYHIIVRKSLMSALL